MRRGPLVVLALLLSVAPAQVCGDCNLDGSATILDALCAAQEHLGVKSPPLTGQGRINCDVNIDGAVTILDALLVAQCAVGILGVPCALACNGLKVVVATPADGQGGDVLVSYLIIDDASDPVDLVVTASTDGGATFRPATRGIGGDGTTGRPSSPSGVPSVFSWDTLADGAGRGCAQGAIVRIAPFDGSGPGLAGGTAVFNVLNQLMQFAGGPVLPGGLPLQEQVQLTLSDGRVLLCGGTRNRTTPVALSFIYDPGTEMITQVASMSTARIGHVGIALAGGDAFIAGGASSLSPLALTDSVEYFDGATSTWLQSPVPLSSPVANASAVHFAARGEILLIGGIQPDLLGNAVITNEAFRYHPNSAAPALSVAGLYNAARFARYQQTLTLLPGPDGTLRTADDLAVIYGGSGQDPAAPPSVPLPGQSLVHGLRVLGDAEIFDPTVGGGQWHQVNDNSYYQNQVQLDPTSSFIGPRRQHAATLLDDGSVLYVGGHAEIDEDFATGAPFLPPADNRLLISERLIVNPSVLPFSAIDPAGSTGFVRVLPSATKLRCGSVLVAGGYDYVAVNQPVIARAELFDPAAPPASAWSVADDLIEGRWLHGASLLGDGRVLLIGGEGGDVQSPFSLATSELYLP